MRAELSGAALVTKRHKPGDVPRPTRPRSWCSCETPKRSASIITMTVAFGTSTPTSITVVETNTSISLLAKARIVASFSSADSRPCSGATVSPLSGPLCNCGPSSSTEAIAVADSPIRNSISASSETAAEIRGATIYAWCPWPTSSLMRLHARSR